MKKRILAILLAVCMLLGILAGCGSSTAEPTTGNTPAANTGKTDTKKEEPSVVTWYFVTGGTTQENLDRINAKGTEMLQAAGINAVLDMKYLSWSQWSSTYSNMLASGEEFDIMNAMNSDFITYGLQGGIYEITADDLANYLPDVAPTMGQNIVDSLYYNGKLYGVPCAHEWAQYSTIQYNAEMAEQYGIDMSQVKTIEDLEAVFAKLAENGIYGVELSDNGSDMLLVLANNDPVNNLDRFCLGIEATVEYNPVHNIFENETIVETLKMFREWVEKGWAYPNVDGDAINQFRQNQTIFCRILRAKPTSCIENSASSTFVTADVKWRDGEAVITSGDAPCGWGHAISGTCSDPVTAMKVLNFAYSNQEFIDLICYGEKDVDYTINENGYVVLNDTGYGKDMNGTMSWEFGNSFGRTPQQDRVDQGLLEEAKIMSDFNQGATKLAHSGFYFDMTNYTAEQSAVQAVCDEYVLNFYRGQYEDVEAALAEFNEALYANGLQTLLDAANEQYDAFRAG